MIARLPILAWFVLALLWGSEWMLAASLPAQPALRSLALRYGAAALLLLPWAVRGRPWRWPLARITAVLATGVGLLAIPQIVTAVAAQHLAAAWSLLALAAVPLMLAVAGSGEIATAMCGFAGVVFLVANGLTIHLPQAPWLLCPLAGALALTWSLKRVMSLMEAAALPAFLFVQFVVAAMLTGTVSPMLEKRSLAWSSSQAIGFLVEVLFATVAAYILFYFVLRKLGPAKVGMLQWLQLLISFAQSALLTQVRPGWEALLGAALVLIGLSRAFIIPEQDRALMLQITGS